MLSQNEQRLRLVRDWELLDENEVKLIAQKPCLQRRDSDVKKLALHLMFRVAYFAKFNFETLKTISERLTPHRFPKGTQIMKEGDKGDKLYVIVTGSLGVFREIDG